MSWTAFFNGILLIAALTTDSFVVSFSYGAGNVRMSMKMILIMNLVMSFLLAGGIWTGRIMENLFPKTIAAVAGAFVLLGMGGYRLLNFFYPGKAQENQDIRELDYFQGIFLAFVLSLDGLVAGIGTGLVQAEEELLIPGAFVGGILMMEAGWRAGSHFRHIFQKDISWISGLCLMILGVGALCKL